MMSAIRKFLNLIKDVFIFFLVGSFYGLIVGIGISMTFYTVRHRYFWCLGITAFFILFHLSDFQNFWKNKDWLAFIGRFAVLFVMTSFIVSVVVFGIGALAEIDMFDLFVPLICIPLSILIGIVGIFLHIYGQHTAFYQKMQSIYKGLNILGVLWK